KLHRDEHAVVVLADVVNRHDVRVREPRERLSLAFESQSAGASVDHLRAQHLDGDLAVELGVMRCVDRAHAAGATQLHDDIAADAAARCEHAAAWWRAPRVRLVEHGIDAAVHRDDAPTVWTAFDVSLDLAGVFGSAA